MSDGMPLPEGLESTAAFLLRAYPTGLPDDDCICLISLLFQHMSHRNMATVLAYLFGRNYNGVLNDIGNAVSVEHQDADSIARVRNKLNAAGYEAWTKEG
jgi:hypothetical protein